MANIRVDLDYPITSGQGVIFKAPVNCSDITGLIVYYPQDREVVSSVFDFADAHGNNVGGLNLFAEGALVKVLLDTELYRAYVQNPDTNEYLEKEFAKRLVAIAHPNHPHCYYREVAIGDGATEVEWINPPMMERAEYRTLERIDGMPVYVCKLPFSFTSSNYGSPQNIPIPSGASNVLVESIRTVSGIHLEDVSLSEYMVSRSSNAISITRKAAPSKTVIVVVTIKYTKKMEADYV